MALGWLSVENTWDFFEYRTDLLPTAERFEPGIFNVMGVVAANASLELFLEVGPENIEKRILENTAYLISQLQDGGYHLFTPIEEQYRSGIVTFNHPRAEKLFEYLKNNKIYLSLRDGMIRISPHFYNAQGDLDYFISMLRKFDQS
ncbi:MAG: aminotransferase class V-fold PLP-dependent enzyme [Calditrichae bacterium]|nr:aminotransferase class V-fold PLP-dependent enzyme [Calditrichia bacterium]